MIKIRLPFMLFAFANLVTGMLAGLIRIGWEFPMNEIAVHHGAIMVGGFLGTLILLEKVIPLKRPVLYLLPILNSLSLVMLVPGFYYIGLSFLVIGSAGLLVVFILYLRKQPNDLSLIFMLVGACCQIIGHSLLIAKQFYPLVFPWWMGFILFIIVGERLELSKFLPVTRKNKNILVGFALLFLMGIFLPFHGIGKYFAGLSLISVGLWLIRHDIISVALKKDGLTRFSAYALLAGCLSLIITGTLMITLPDLPFAYDAIVHTFFLGFAFTMIFAHGPFILPGVLGFNIKPYHPLLYFPLLTMLSSIALRILADMTIIPHFIRLWSGLISVISILLYFIILLSCTVAKIRNEKSS